MKPKFKDPLPFLLIIWCLFFLGGYYLDTLPKSELSDEIRYDLLVLPILLLVSVYLIYEQIRSCQNK